MHRVAFSVDNLDEALESGRFYLSIGFRRTVLMGALFVIAGAALLLPVSADSAVWQLALPCFVMGIGFGYVHAVFICSAVVALALLLSGLLMPRQAIAEE